MTNLNADRPADDSDPITSALPVLMENRGRFLAFLTKRIGQAEIAEEILQHALIKIIERDPLIADDRVSAWFYRVLSNAIADYYRRQAAESRALNGWRASQAEMADDDDLQQTVCACMGDLIPTLKPE
ncbi:MAG TPA: sigma factor, partial [Lacipirellulaceae bacterium]|nr:sigma factor [Lacipirellulaceae bacterium]